MILGSGYTFHNLDAFFNPSNSSLREASKFNDWLKRTVQSSSDMKTVLKDFSAWELAPGARTAHPREEHLLPLFMAAASGGDSATATMIYDNSDIAEEHHVSGYVFN